MTRGGTWDSSRPARGELATLVAAGVLFGLPGLVATWLRLVPPRDDATALLAAFIPYGILAYVLSLCCILIALIRARHRWALLIITTAVAGMLALHASWLAPFFVPDHRAATTKPFTLLSVNTYAGAADPHALLDQAQQADVVILLEATPEALNTLAVLGLGTRFPYAIGDPKQGVSNTAIYSRFPLSDSVLVQGTLFQQYVTTVAVPAIGAVRLIGVHICNPYCGDGRWALEHAILRATVDANLNQPLVIAGDFNAIDDHGPLQALRLDGLKSAADIVGAGWMPTYPARRLMPPLLPIDHVMINNRLTATSIRTIKIAGTDHLGLITTIAGTK
jgi:endonuclease/exonuclease/phosphatase (EEP) superfamily protein YafD